MCWFLAKITLTLCLVLSKIILTLFPMYQRKLFSDLKEWKLKANRKPLILRGAQQVGKTTLIKMFAAEFDYFIPLVMLHYIITPNYSQWTIH